MFARCNLAEAQGSVDLANLTLEELLNTRVTSVSKKEQTLFQTPSAIAVLTHEDIRRAGATSIPEALRLVPGLQVASIDGNSWAVSARGFNSLYSNKLLVMIDGRSVYNPTYSGVFWDTQDVPIEDIERIEVIRGPGAALWGANAMNGVINIITAPAADSQGTTMSVTAGSLDRGSFSARYGGHIGANSDYRVSTKLTNRDQTDAGRSSNDDWRVGHVQARFDTTLSPSDTLVASVGAGLGEIGQARLMVTGVMPWQQTPLTKPIDADQFNVLTRWNRKVSPRSDFFLQASVDRTHRAETMIGSDMTIVNVDAQHHATFGRHDIVSGIGQRLTSDRELTTFAFAMAREHERIGLTNAFVQDEIAFVPDRVTATFGSKVEYSSVSGASVQPDVRLAVTPTTRQTIWASASHAIRTPSRNERFMTFRYLDVPTPTLPLVLAITGNPALQPESLNVFEVGYRVHPMPRVHIDATAFVNNYTHVERFQDITYFESDPSPAHLVDAFQYVNSGSAGTHGVEVLVETQPMQRWHLSAAISTIDAHFTSTQTNLVPVAVNSGSPTYQWFLSSRATLSHNIETDATLFRVGDLQAGHVPAYSRLDARLGWTLTKNIGVSVIGQNLLDAHHIEFDQIDGLVGSRIPRSIGARLTVGF